MEIGNSEGTMRTGGGQPLPAIVDKPAKTLDAGGMNNTGSPMLPPDSRLEVIDRQRSGGAHQVMTP